MSLNKLIAQMVPAAMMMGAALGMTGTEIWFKSFATSAQSYWLLGQVGLALPYTCATLIGLFCLLAMKRSLFIQSAGWSVMAGGFMIAGMAFYHEAVRVMAIRASAPDMILGPLIVWARLGGAAAVLSCALFAAKVGQRGIMAFGRLEPKRIVGSRALYGASAWMTKAQAAKLFSHKGGIVIGENDRPDHSPAAHVGFNLSRKETWGNGGKAPLLCFDGSFGSTHGLAFAGSGGFKTTSVVVPTALRFTGTLIVLDPSTEIAPMVANARRKLGQNVFTLDPRKSETGFNVLDWVGKHGFTKEEDIASVAAWLMSEKPRVSSGSDDFFRTMAEQLICAITADVMLGEDDMNGCDDGDDSQDKRSSVGRGEKSLRVVRQRLAQPEKTLQKKLESIHQNAPSRFVRENVAPFINMTEQTFSGVYATAAKETHWLSYENYAALVSGSAFCTDDIAIMPTTVLINIDLATLENHPGLARVITGAFLKALYNRDGNVTHRALFLLDEAARLGYMRILETARDAGRKYGITLLMLFQSLGQMREAFGGRDAISKWFESASWVSFAAVNDIETAEYVSKRCGMTTTEIDQISRNAAGGKSGHNRSKQLAPRPLILPHEVSQMRTDEQIIFTSANPPLRCGRAIYFRRRDMLPKVSESRFKR